MKKLLAMGFLIWALTACQSGDKVPQANVPDPVVQSFYERYPVATDIVWYKNGNQYQVKFDYDGDAKKAAFKEDGTFLEATK